MNGDVETYFGFLIVLCFCRVSIFQCQIISMSHTFQLEFVSFSILSLFHSFHVAFSSCGIFSVWHFLHVAFSPCGIFSVNRITWCYLLKSKGGHAFRNIKLFWKLSIIDNFSFYWETDGTNFFNNGINFLIHKTYLLIVTLLFKFVGFHFFR